MNDRHSWTPLVEVLGVRGKGLVENRSKGYVLSHKCQRLTDMGRGLSDLQSTILRLALKNRVQTDRNQAELRELRKQLKAERSNAARRKELIGKIRPLDNEISRRRRKTNTDLSRHEVLVDHWGWRPAKEGFANERFSKAQLGDKPYNAVLASLSRAVARLEKRGLVVRQHATIYGPPGIDLTDRGLEEALKTNGKQRDYRRRKQEGTEKEARAG